MNLSSSPPGPTHASPRMCPCVRFYDSPAKYLQSLFSSPVVVFRASRLYDDVAPVPLTSHEYQPFRRLLRNGRQVAQLRRPSNFVNLFHMSPLVVARTVLAGYELGRPLPHHSLPPRWSMGMSGHHGMPRQTLTGRP